MTSKSSGWSDRIRWMIPITLAMACVVFLTMVLGEFAKDMTFQVAWPVLLQLIGVFVLLAGVLGILRHNAEHTAGAPDPTHGRIALMLAGGMLTGGGWGAALGLGLLGAATVFARRDRQHEESASEEDRRITDRPPSSSSASSS